MHMLRGHSGQTLSRSTYFLKGDNNLQSLTISTSFFNSGRLFKIAILAGALLTFNCGSSSTDTKPVTQSQRTGRANSSVDAKYVDEAASINSDGTKIIFTSGRDGGTPRIYKSTFSGGTWSAPAKLSAGKLTPKLCAQIARAEQTVPRQFAPGTR